jgi:phosphatidylinositol-3-phosphatase
MRLFPCLLMVVVCACSFATAQVPSANHVFIVVLENHGYSSVVGNSAMPYLNSLASKYGLATQYYGNTHPSIGNYFMMSAGQIYSNNDALTSTINIDNAVRHLLTAGKTWKSYAESLPYAGYTGGDKYPYVKHHNPFAYFSDVANSSVEKMRLVPFTQFKTDLSNGALPEFSFIVPNMHDDGHDCPAGMSSCTDWQKLNAADNWLKYNIGPLLGSLTFQNGGLLIITTDEASTSDTSYGGGHVATIVVSPKAKSGYRSTAHYQHQSLLKTALTAIGVTTFPGSASSAPAMADFFGTGGAAPCSPPASAGVKICAPVQNSTTGTSVSTSAAVTGSHPISAVWVYVDGTVRYKTTSSSVNTYLTLATGTHNMNVQAWDTSGVVYKSTVQFSVN